MAADGGASALLVFPPAPFTLQQSPEMALAHFKRIADASDLPIIVFQYPLATGQGYPNETLLHLCEQVPTVRAIRTGSATCRTRLAHPHAAEFARPVNVLTTHSSWLLPSWCSGLTVCCRAPAASSRSAGKAVPRREGNDLASGQVLADRIEPTARVFYADPFVDMHNRMKEAAGAARQLPRAVVPPPLGQD